MAADIEVRTFASRAPVEEERLLPHLRDCFSQRYFFIEIKDMRGIDE